MAHDTTLADNVTEQRPEAFVEDEFARPREVLTITAPETRSRRGRTFLVTVGVAFATVALQLAQGVLLARLLGPEGRGEYAASIFYTQMLIYVGMFGGLEAACRRAADAPSGLDALKRSALRLGFLTGAVSTLAAVVLSLLAMPESKSYLLPLAVVCALSLTGQQVVLIITAVDRGSNAFGRFNVQRILAAGVFPLVLLLVALIAEVTPMMAAIILVGSSIVTMLAALQGLSRPVLGPSDPPVRSLFRESVPYGFSMLATDLYERLDLFLVLWLAPLVTQGFYAAMVPAVYPLTVIPNTLGLFLFNAGASRDGGLTVRQVHRILASSLLIQLISTCAFMLVIGPVVRVVYGEEFSEAVIFALWLAPVSGIRGVIQGLDSYLKGRGRPLAPVMSRLAAAVVMLITTALTYESFGVVSIPLGALVGQVLCLVWLTGLVYAETTRHVPVADS